MKTISPWFQTARLLTGIRKAISASESGRTSPSQPSGTHSHGGSQLRNVSRYPSR
ncbi:MAG: hypothetical protein KDA79_24310 [Planctomycetaceae bacterium]|nr:hypothetical protein [Planctomycetaceae bacterium]